MASIHLSNTVPSWWRRRRVDDKVKGPWLGLHREYASGEERVRIRGWLHLTCGVSLLMVSLLYWELFGSLPTPTLSLIACTSAKDIISGTLHAVIPPSAPLVILFGVHFIDIVAIVVAEAVSGMAFMAPSDWNPQIALCVVCAVIVGACEAPLWPLKLMRPPGKEHIAIKARYAVIALLAVEAQCLVFRGVWETHNPFNMFLYTLQFLLYCFGFHSTATRPVRRWHCRGVYEAHDDLHTIAVIADAMLIYLSHAYWTTKG